MNIIPVKIGYRSLSRYKMFSLVNILGLSLVYCSLFIILIYIYNEFSTDKFHENIDRIVVVDHATPRRLAEEIHSHIPGVESTLRLRPLYGIGSVLNNGEYSFSVDDILFSDDSFFEFFTFDFLSGNKRTCLQSPESVVLTESLSLKLFGTNESTGKALRFNDTISLNVTAVISNLPVNSSHQFSALVPLDVLKLIDNPSLFSKWNYSDCETFLLLSSPSKIYDIQTNLAEVAKPMGKSSENMNLIKYRDYYFESGDTVLRQGNLQKVWVFVTIAFILLFMGITNYITLFSSMFFARKNSLLTNQLFGSGRKNTVYQLIFESVFISLVSSGLAMVLVEIVSPLFISGVDIKKVIATYGLIKYIFTIFCFSIVMGVITGLWPAFRFVSEANKSMVVDKQQISLGGKKTRRLLFSSQLLISTVLLSCTLVIIKQIYFLNSNAQGFVTDDIVCITIPTDISNKYDLIRERLEKSFIEGEFGFCSNIPGTIEGYSTVKYPDDDRIFLIQELAVDMECLDLLGIDILEQEHLAEGIRSSQQIILLNETAVGEFGFTNPIGKKMPGPPSYQPKVVGVVRDFHIAPYYENILPLCIYFDPEFFKYILVRSDYDLQRFHSILSVIWDDLSSEYEPEYALLDDLMRASYSSDVKLGSLLTIFSLQAIMIVFIGLFGLILFTTERREKEICIRKIHGALLDNILKLFAKENILLLMISIFIALPVAIWLSGKWLMSFAYHISLSADIFILATLIISTVVYLAILAGVTRAVRKKPAIALSQN